MTVASINKKAHEKTFVFSHAQSREKIYIKGISQRRMPDFLGGHPDNLTELISYRIIGVP